jgi:hypothetical protein
VALPRLEALRDEPRLAAELREPALRERLDVPRVDPDVDRDDVERDDGRLVLRAEERLDPPDLLLADRDDEPAVLLRLRVPLVERLLVEREPLALLALVPRLLAARLLSERLLVPRAALVAPRRVADLLRPRG